MNIAFILIPKANNVAYVYDDFSLRQSLEKMRHHRYSSIPVITREGKYAGVLSEGDLLWYMVDCYKNGEFAEFKELEKIRTSKVISKNIYEGRPPVSPVRITAQIDELVDIAMRQNFVPVIDDNENFIGIVTRRDVIRYLRGDLNQAALQESAGI